MAQPSRSVTRVTGAICRSLSFSAVDTTRVPAKLNMPSVVSSEPCRMMAFAPFQRGIRGMSAKRNYRGEIKP